MMKMSIIGAHRLKEIYLGLDDLKKSQFNYAATRALNKTAEEVKGRLVQEMGLVFDRPTPWTLNSIRIIYAKKTDLKATVWLKDKYAVGTFGTPATKYLLPEIEGGDRNLKRFEKALQYAHILPTGMYCVPGEAADLDAYGNVKASLIIQLISYFRGFRVSGSNRANITGQRKSKLWKGTKKQRGYAYFAISNNERGHLKPGIYRRTSFGTYGTAIKPIIMFVRKPAYQPRFGFYDLSRRMSDMVFPDNFRWAMDEALRTAKPK